VSCNTDDHHSAASSATTTKRKRASAAEPAAASSSKTEMPRGENGSLKGLKLLFTGTIKTMNREDCEATAIEQGAEIMPPENLAECDMVVLGARAKKQQLDAIEEEGMKTITEAEFFEMLGEPCWMKRMGFQENTVEA
jgi:BRCT domain type II-containing protein